MRSIKDPKNASKNMESEIYEMKTEKEVEKEVIKLTRSFIKSMEKAQAYDKTKETLKAKFYYERAATFCFAINIFNEVLEKDEYL